MKLKDFSWQREGDRQVLDCQIVIDGDGTYAIQHRDNPSEESERFTSPDDLGRTLSQAIQERQPS